MKKYTTLYFDLDNTLLDFSAAEYKAIRKLFTLHNLPISDEKIAKVTNGTVRGISEGKTREKLKRKKYIRVDLENILSFMALMVTQ